MAIYTGSLVLYLDAGTGSSYPGSGSTWTDLSGLGNDGTLTNGPTFSSGNGGSIVFDGTDDVVNCGTSSTLAFSTTSEATITAWIYPTSFGEGSRARIIERQYLFFLDNVNISNGIAWYPAGSATQALNTANSITLNKWQYVAIVHSGTTSSLYINGSLISTRSNVGNTIGADAGQVFYIGNNAATDRSFQGNIAIVQVYSASLSSAQIYENFDTERTRFEVELTPTPTPTRTPSLTPSITRTPSITPTVTRSETPTPTVTRTPSISLSPSRTPSITPTVTRSETPTPTVTRTPSISLTPSRTPSVTPTITLTQTPSVTPSISVSSVIVSPSLTPSVTPSITSTPSITPTLTPTKTPTKTVTPSVTPTPSTTPVYNLTCDLFNISSSDYSSYLLSGFGRVIAMNDNTMVVGNQTWSSLGSYNGFYLAGNTHPTWREGKAYVFSGSNYTVEKQLIPSDISWSLQFGCSTDITNDGGYVFVGALNNNGYSPGKVYVFSGSNRTETQIISAGDFTSSVYLYGYDVKVSPNGSTLVVASPSRTTSYSGKVYVYTGSNWSTEYILTPDNPSSTSRYFARSGYLVYSQYSVACSADGKTIVVASPYDSASNGAVYVYSGTNWSTKTIITASYTDDAWNFGISVACSADGTKIFISNDEYTLNDYDFASGIVHIYTGSNSTWSLYTTITSSYLGIQDSLYGGSYYQFGTGLAVSDAGDTLFVTDDCSYIGGSIFSKDYTEYDETFLEHYTCTGVIQTSPNGLTFAFGNSNDDDTVTVYQCRRTPDEYYNDVYIDFVQSGIAPTPSPSMAIYNDREYQSDFEITGFIVSGASTTRRPDTVSENYLTAFSLGPIDTADTSQGLLSRVWKVRADSANNVWYAKENGANWTSETLLFTYTGSAILEVDLAFEQNGRPVVAAERATGVGGSSEVWIYWFDPLVSGFVFARVNEGRTPRLVLDDPVNQSISDVLLFYVNTGSNYIQYGVQSERYETVNNTPVTGVNYTYLEEAQRDLSGRVLVSYSTRDTSSGQYALNHLASGLYPAILTVENIFVSGSVSGSSITEATITSSMDIEYIFVSGSVSGSSIQETLITSSLDIEYVFVSGSVSGSSIRDVLITSSLDIEYVFVSGSVSGSDIKTILITSSMDIEYIFASGSVSDATITIP